MSTEAATQGRAGAAGRPTNGSMGNATTPAPTAISTVVRSGSRPRLMVAFQPAWAAAANRTAAKTRESIGGFRSVLYRESGRSKIRLGKKPLNTGEPVLPRPQRPPSVHTWWTAQVGSFYASIAP